MNSIQMFDSHAHYFDRSFNNKAEIDTEFILKNDVFGSGVGWVVNVGTNPKNSLCAIQMAKQYEGMYVSVGIHPEDAQFLEESSETALAAIESLLSNPEERKQNKIVALGEIGLDYHSWATGGFVPNKGLQKLYFEKQLLLAEKLQIPVIIHDREAHGDCFETLLRFPKVTGVFHSYSGSLEMAKELMRRGWYISFSGVVTFKNAERVREVAAGIPLDRLMIETDAPYLAPHPYRGKPNHSGLMRYTAEALADLHGVSAEELIKVTAENAAKLYRISSISDYSN